MSEQWKQHIGDGQLVHGLPKHISATAKDTKPMYWQYVPKPGACEKCQAMKNLWFRENPGPVHPNCKCEIRQEPIPGVTIQNTLQGYESHATEKFSAGQKITVEIKNLGPFVAGVTICVDREVWKQTRHLLPGESQLMDFTKFGDPPVPWEIFLIYSAGDNSTIQYFITG